MTHESFSLLLPHFKLHLRFVLVVSLNPFGTCFLMLTKKLCFPFIWLQFQWKCMFIDKIDCFFTVIAFRVDLFHLIVLVFGCFSLHVFLLICGNITTFLIVYEMPFICNYTICWLYRLGPSFILIIQWILIPYVEGEEN